MALTSALANSPRTILQTLADKVLEVLQANSAGLSLLTKDKKRFYWAAIAGAWQPHIGGGTPRDFGPCGDVLDHNRSMLFTHWERRYPYLSVAVARGPKARSARSTADQALKRLMNLRVATATTLAISGNLSRTELRTQSQDNATFFQFTDVARARQVRLQGIGNGMLRRSFHREPWQSCAPPARGGNGLGSRKKWRRSGS